MFTDGAGLESGSVARAMPPGRLFDPARDPDPHPQREGCLDRQDVAAEEAMFILYHRKAMPAVPTSHQPRLHKHVSRDP
jgi:hypothetical protein